MGTQGIDGSVKAGEETKPFAKRRCIRKAISAQTMCSLVFGQEFSLGATGCGVGFNYGSTARDDHPEFHHAGTDRALEIKDADACLAPIHIKNGFALSP